MRHPSIVHGKFRGGIDPWTHGRIHAAAGRETIEGRKT
jgi:hypothetical protein